MKLLSTLLLGIAYAQEAGGETGGEAGGEATGGSAADTPAGN